VGSRAGRPASLVCYHYSVVSYHEDRSALADAIYVARDVPLNIQQRTLSQSFVYIYLEGSKTLTETE
jgi:hypothetical protein